MGRTIEKNMYYGAGRELIEKARILRKKMTYAEKLLWERIRNKKLNGIVFRRQHPVEHFIADFYCHKYKLVIEVDGGIHETPEVSERDKGREYEIEKFGIKVIRVTNYEVINNMENVIQIIKSHLKE